VSIVSHTNVVRLWLLEPVLVDYSGGKRLAIFPIRTDNSSSAVDRRSHGKFQRARGNFQKKFNLLLFPKNFAESK
jgi:hypothetical protein